MSCRLEHANLTVRDLNATVRFLTTAFPEFRVRGGSTEGDSNPWLHVGTESTYLAISQGHGTEGVIGPDSAGFNHLGYVVADADGLRTRMLAAGYREGYLAEPHPYRKRVYILDEDGVEWEFVQYLTDDPALQNEYSA